MATRRDQYCIAWIAEQYAARGDQIQRLLSRFPDQQRPFKGELLAETTLKDQLSRWRRAGWIEYRRVLADEPGFAWVTRQGLQLVDLDDIYTSRVPASTRLDHIYAVNQLRLWLDQKYTWKSERRYRADLLSKETKKGGTLGPIPDGLITTKSGLVAIEAEISAKKPADVYAKLTRLVRLSTPDGMMGYQKAFPAIWFYVPNERPKELIESAIEELQDDEQKRVSVAIEEDLIASKFR